MLSFKFMQFHAPKFWPDGCQLIFILFVIRDKIKILKKIRPNNKKIKCKKKSNTGNIK